MVYFHLLLNSFISNPFLPRSCISSSPKKKIYVSNTSHPSLLLAGQNSNPIYFQISQKDTAEFCKIIFILC